MAVLKSPVCTITWPAHPGPWWETRIVDGDGRDLTPVVLSMVLTLLPNRMPTVLLTTLVDEQGGIAANEGPTCLSHDGVSYLTGTFEYAVLEMRLKED